jgi:hypothetical protein
MFEFLLLTLPPWFFAVGVAVVVPNLFDLLAFVTALTTPAISLGFPAVCFYYYFSPQEDLFTPPMLFDNPFRTSTDSGTDSEGAEGKQAISDGVERESWANRGLRTCSVAERQLCLGCFVSFLGAFATCMVGAIGQVGRIQMQQLAQW